ncbi:FMN-binding protein [Raoultibacter phocaeensis]|uniref:FMN-binding protein n=1 Tax=Raoultibacter phocaeensis TaxID=2479841 RepID=UPI00210853A3|nr:FMN-binding protein [Raoultibacter phocaeensis]
MKRQIAFAACCLAMSVSPLLAGCSPNADATSEQPEAGVESSQNTNASGGDSKQEAPKSTYKDGTYEGEGKGMHGPITVTLTVADGVITVDELTGSAETAGVGGKEAIEDGTFKAQIEEAQSPEIDGVSGATMTSGGVMKAVEAALAQAK